MRNKGFTLIEVAIAVVVVFIVVGVLGIYGGIIKGNFWVSEESALKAIKRIEPNMVEVVEMNRRVWRYSKVIARDKDGVEHEFGIDANILQNRTAHRW